MLKGVTDLGVTRIALESNTGNDYVPNVQACLQRNPSLLVTVGFNLAKATKDAAKKNPNTNFAIIDYPSEAKNILGLNFSTDQAAFLAGYVAAGMTKTGKVGTFGGINIPPVTIYMNGFAAGILKYNQDFGTTVTLLGWDPTKQDGTFSGDFTNEQNGQRITQQFISQGADIIFPVAGPVGLGAAAGLAKQAGNVNLIWVDVDGCVSAPEYCNLFITSVEKKMDVAVFQTISDVVDGTFKGGDYQGTLANDGVGLAPYHNFASTMPQALQDKVTALKAGSSTDRSRSIREVVLVTSAP